MEDKELHSKYKNSPGDFDNSFEKLLKGTFHYCSLLFFRRRPDFLVELRTISMVTKINYLSKGKSGQGVQQDLCQARVNVCMCV